MKTQRLILCAAVLLARFCAPAQGTFQNLNFEQAVDAPGSFLMSASNAFPGWTVYGGGIPLTEVGHDNALGAPVGLGDSAAPYLVLEGSFSVILGSVFSPISGAIAQSGVIPAGSESLRFLALGELSVFFAGHSLPLQVLGNLPYFGQIYGANISAYAGQYGQLMFQTSPSSFGGINILDDISFSTQAIQEPGVLSILGLGASMLSLLHWARRARSAGIH
jgi:hypothetical protein